MSLCVSVCLSFRPSHFVTLFNGLFAPTSKSPMSNLFRYSESVGKSNGKKWSHIWKLLLIKGVKSPRENLALLANLFGIGATIRIGWEIQCLPYAGFLFYRNKAICPKIGKFPLFSMSGCGAKFLRILYIWSNLDHCSITSFKLFNVNMGLACRLAHC